MKNQGGFATIEIILVVMIISLLSTIALPNMARMIDVARLDYEMKIFLSNLDFAKSLNKNVYYNREIFKNADLGNVAYELQVDIDDNLNRYTIMQNGKPISETHELPSGFSIRCDAGLSNHIDFVKSNNGHVTLTSRYGVKRYIYFDTVGRWYGDIK